MCCHCLRRCLKLDPDLLIRLSCLASDLQEFALLVSPWILGPHVYMMSELLFCCCAKTPWPQKFIEKGIWGGGAYDFRELDRVHEHHGRECGSRWAGLVMKWWLRAYSQFSSVRQRRLRMAWSFDTSNHTSSGTPPITRPYLIILPKEFQVETKCSNICAYNGHSHGNFHSWHALHWTCCSPFLRTLF